MVYGGSLPGRKKTKHREDSLLEEQQESPPRLREGAWAERGRKLSQGLGR